MSANVNKELQQRGGKPAGDRIDGPDLFGPAGQREAQRKFDAAVANIAARDKISKLAAIAKVRTENPDGVFTALQSAK